jgi:hypothetical protein
MFTTTLMGIFRLKSDLGPPPIGIGAEPPPDVIGFCAAVS